MRKDVRGFTENIGPYRDQATTFLAQTRASFERNLPPALRDTLDGAIDRLTVFALDGFAHALKAATTEWLSHVVEIVIIPILAFYFLTDGAKGRTPPIPSSGDAWIDSGRGWVWAAFSPAMSARKSSS